MFFSYEKLKFYEETGSKIGDWKGSGVYVASKHNLKRKDPDDWYILYDDGNKLVGFISGDWYVLGYVNDNGTVREIAGKLYVPENEMKNTYGLKSKNEMKNETKKSNEKMESKNQMKNSFEISNEEVIGDVRLGIAVDEMLESARTMTIDLLLAGFDYGLDEAVG